jgi:hypothetical protein
VLRKWYVLAMCMFSVLLTSGCFNIQTPSETMKIPEYSEPDKVFNQYKEMLQKNKPPKDLLAFLGKNIIKLHKSSADIAVVRVIELQKKQLVKYQEKLLDVEYSKQLINIESKEVHDITDSKVRNWAIDLIDNGFKLRSTEIEIDYELINKIADNYVSDELKDYIKIESKESEKKYSGKESLDSYLAHYPNKVGNFVQEISDMLNKTFAYTTKYKDSPYIVRVNQLKSEYLQIFFFGSPNNSTFTYYQGSDKANNIIDKQWNNAYIMAMNTYGKNEFGVFISNYYNELSKNKWFLSKDLYTYINKKINNQDV